MHFLERLISRYPHLFQPHIFKSTHICLYPSLRSWIEALTNTSYERFYMTFFDKTLR